ncbi:hypothetical protein IMSAGC011_02385 [Lachnospiraceae bacterium]|nr:hypothetical protein IMSAGC011_02385 [Lachnospiraceae bacterium]
MIQKRYTDIAQLITNIDKLELTDVGEVLIYCGDKWYGEVTVNLGGKEEKFEELKPMIVHIAKNLCKIDLIAQRYMISQIYYMFFQILLFNRKRNVVRNVGESIGKYMWNRFIKNGTAILL